MPPVNMRGNAKPKNAKQSFKRMLSYLKPHKVKLILVAVMILIASFVSIYGINQMEVVIADYIVPLAQQTAQEQSKASEENIPPVTVTEEAPESSKDNEENTLDGDENASSVAQNDVAVSETEMVQESAAGEKKSIQDFARFLIKLLFIYLFGAVATFAYGRIMMYVSTNVLNTIRKDMFRHMEDLPIAYFDKHTHGEIMSHYTNDTDTMREFMSQTLPQVLSCVATIVFSFVSMASNNFILTILVVVMMPVLMILTKKIGKHAGAFFVAQQKAIGTLNGYIEETIEGQRVVQVFCHEEEAIKSFEKNNEQVRLAGTKANTFASIMGPISNNLSHLYYVITALVGAILVVNHVFDYQVAALITFLILTNQFARPISNLAQQLNTVMLALAGAERIFALMDEAVEEDEGYVTLVNAKKDEKGAITECTERTGMWAWKHPHSDGTVTYTQLKGDVVFENVTFGYVP